LEVALGISNRNGGPLRVILGPGVVLTGPTYHVGFDVPQKDIFSFASTQFLTVRSVPPSHPLSCANDCS